MRRLLSFLIVLAVLVLAGVAAVVVWRTHLNPARTPAEAESPALSQPASQTATSSQGPETVSDPAADILPPFSVEEPETVFVLDLTPAAEPPSIEDVPAFAPAEPSLAASLPDRVLGLDVSAHQGSIDWTTAAVNLSFAFIRTGYRTYGYSGTVMPDPYYTVNLAGARAAGLDVGVYFFSQAITEAEAVEEAEFVLQRLAGTALELPIVFDFEYISGVSGRLEGARLSVDAATDICLAFCRRIEQAGFTAMVYSNKLMLENRLDAGRLASEFPIWLSHWDTTQTDYQGDYDYLQFTSTGVVAGVDGDVDLDFRYHMIPDQVGTVRAESAASGSILLTWDKLPGVWGYRVYRQTGDGWEQAAQLTGASRTQWTDDELEAGRTYTYRVRALSICQGQVWQGPASESIHASPGGAEIAFYSIVADTGRLQLSRTSDDAWLLRAFELENLEGVQVCAAVYDSEGQQLFMTSGTIFDAQTILTLPQNGDESCVYVYLLDPDALAPVAKSTMVSLADQS